MNAAKSCPINAERKRYSPTRVMLAGRETMISRSLSRLLKRLEARAMPAGEPMVMKIQFVAPREGVIDTWRRLAPTWSPSELLRI